MSDAPQNPLTNMRALVAARAWGVGHGAGVRLVGGTGGIGLDMVGTVGGGGATEAAEARELLGECVI